jgi:hypothetical protein
MNEGLSSAKDWEDRHRPLCPFSVVVVVVGRSTRSARHSAIAAWGDITFPCEASEVRHTCSRYFAAAAVSHPFRPPSVVFSVAANKRSSSLRRLESLGGDLLPAPTV